MTTCIIHRFTEVTDGYQREAIVEENLWHFTVLERKQPLQQVENFGKNSLEKKKMGRGHCFWLVIILKYTDISIPSHPM